MSYVNPELRYEFESLTIKMKNKILSRNVRINTPEELKAVIARVEAEESGS